MKRTARQYVNTQKSEKITEKVLYTRIGISVTIIVIAVIAMAFSAFAYFTADVSSTGNFMKAAEHDVNVEILHKKISYAVSANADDEPTEASSEPTVSYESVSVEKAGLNYTANLKSGQHQIKLTNSGSAETGFCIISFDHCDTAYYTQQIGSDRNSPTRTTNSIVFHLNLPSDTVIYIFPHWGTSSYYGYEANAAFNYITSGENITIDLNVEPTQEPSNKSIELPSSVTVEEGDSLSAIASEYNISLDLLKEYNEITDADNIPAGIVINIPPKDWAPKKDIPSDEVPNEETPAEETSAEETPTEETPTEETPTEETPTEETPAEETPTEETPTEETPAEETPAEETPAEETPTEETPTEETPTEETPTEETPTEETPTEEIPTEETPTEETPAVETPTEETT